MFGVSGYDYSMALFEQAQKLGAEVQFAEVQSVEKTSTGFKVTTPAGEFVSDKIVSTMPANEFCHIYKDTNKPAEILDTADNLRYNSIAISIVNVKKDYAGDNYAFMVADKNVKFHRISKLDFMGENYHIDGTATYMAEITYRKTI